MISVQIFHSNRMRLAMVIDKRVQPSPQQMEVEKLKWSKLEFAFYVKGKNGFTSVSQPTYTCLFRRFTLDDHPDPCNDF